MSGSDTAGTVAVTGGSGFIGSNVVDALLASGRTVRVLDTRPPGRDDVAFVEADILDADSLLPAFVAGVREWVEAMLAAVTARCPSLLLAVCCAHTLDSPVQGSP